MNTRLASSSASQQRYSAALVVLLTSSVAIHHAADAFILGEPQGKAPSAVPSSFINNNKPLSLLIRDPSAQTGVPHAPNNLKAASVLTEQEQVLEADGWFGPLAVPPPSAASSSSSLSQQQQQKQLSLPSLETVSDFVLPVLSAALLITSNTVGAGCLVMPELAAGPGLATSAGIFAAAYGVNLLSGLLLADVAITQKENAASDEDVPASFQEFAQANLGSPAAANVISGLSIATNAAVHAFVSSKVGMVGSALLGGAVAPAAVSIAWAVAWWSLLSTQSSQKLSGMGNLFCTLLFASFGGLLLPGLAHVADPVATFLAPGTAAAAGSDAWTAAVAHAAPVMLMSMVYQNIVPTITKLLDYDRAKTVTAISVGSLLPLVMYLSWCVVCLGGGVDTASDVSSSGLLYTLFSVVTLAGSTLGTSLSMAGELQTFFKPSSSASKQQQEASVTTTESQVAVDAIDDDTSSNSFGALSAAAAVGLPLGAALLFASGGEGSSTGFTEALSVAGSFGSPLLYGAIPVAMAWRQRQQKQQQQQQSPSKRSSPLVPAATLPLLGLCSVGFIGQELVQRVSEAIAI